MRWNKKEKSYKKVLGFEPRTLGTIATRLIRSAIYIYIEYFCASLMIIMNDIDVILSIPVSPVFIIVLALFNGKSLPTFVNHTIILDQRQYDKIWKWTYNKSHGHIEL